MYARMYLLPGIPNMLNLLTYAVSFFAHKRALVEKGVLLANKQPNIACGRPVQPYTVLGGTKTNKNAIYIT